MDNSNILNVKFKSGEVCMLDPVDDQSYNLGNDTYTLSGMQSGTWIVTPVTNPDIDETIGLSVRHHSYSDVPADLLVCKNIKSATGFICFMDKTFLIKLKAGFENTNNKNGFNNMIINSTEEYPNCSIVLGRIAVADIRCTNDDCFSLYATHTDAGKVVSLELILEDS